jgi:Zn-dependent protease
MALWFSVIFNVNLALINLLPIPVLDGGHIMLALIETVRRKPGQREVASVCANGLRGVDHWLYAVRHLLRLAGSALEE